MVVSEMYPPYKKMLGCNLYFARSFNFFGLLENFGSFLVCELQKCPLIRVKNSEKNLSFKEELNSILFSVLTFFILNTVLFQRSMNLNGPFRSFYNSYLILVFLIATAN